MRVYCKDVGKKQRKEEEKKHGAGQSCGRRGYEGNRTHVVVLPREVGGEVTTGGKGLASLDDEKVLDVELLVLRRVEVLLGDEDAL